jgi:hypothetical protein
MSTLRTSSQRARKNCRWPKPSRRSMGARLTATGIVPTRNMIASMHEADTMQRPIIGKGGRPTLHRTAPVACPRSFIRFWDDEVVPLICPTCQLFGRSHRLRRAPATLHGVVFDIFGGSGGDQARRRPA